MKDERKDPETEKAPKSDLVRGFAALAEVPFRAIRAVPKSRRQMAYAGACASVVVLGVAQSPTHDSVSLAAVGVAGALGALTIGLEFLLLRNPSKENLNLQFAPIREVMDMEFCSSEKEEAFLAARDEELRAMALAQRGETAEARSTFERALRRYEHLATTGIRQWRSYLGAGRCHARLGWHEAAISQYEIVVRGLFRRINESTPAELVVGALVNIAQAQYEKGDKREALDALTVAARVCDNAPVSEQSIEDVVLNSMVVEASLGYEDRSRMAYEQLRHTRPSLDFTQELGPEDLSVMGNYAWFQAKPKRRRIGSRVPTGLAALVVLLLGLANPAAAQVNGARQYADIASVARTVGMGADPLASLRGSGIFRKGEELFLIENRSNELIQHDVDLGSPEVVRDLIARVLDKPAGPYVYRARNPEKSPRTPEPGTPLDEFKTIRGSGIFWQPPTERFLSWLRNMDMGALKHNPSTYTDPATSDDHEIVVLSNK